MGDSADLLSSVMRDEKDVVLVVQVAVSTDAFIM
jgi:hypothetical protein